MSTPPRERLVPREADAGAPVGSSHADAMLFKGHVAPDVLKHLFGVDRSIAVGSLAQIGSGNRGRGLGGRRNRSRRGSAGEGRSRRGSGGGSRCPGSLGGRGNGHRGSYGRRRRGIERRNLGVVIVRRDERIVIRRHIVFPRLAIGIYVTLREDRGAASVIGDGRRGGGRRGGGGGNGRLRLRRRRGRSCGGRGRSAGRRGGRGAHRGSRDSRGRRDWSGLGLSLIHI